MFKDIYFSGPREVSMTKKLFGNNELSLAQCLQLEVDDSGPQVEIRANIETTTQKALFHFISECFQSFSQNPGNKQYRDAFYEDLDSRYKQMFQEFYDTKLVKCGYQDMLFDHQKEGLAESNYKKFNFLAYEQGLGKTLTSATISKINNIKRTLIICPLLVKWNWFRDLTKFGYNELYFSIYDSVKSKNLKAFPIERFAVINFEGVGKYMEELCSEPIGHIIIDEATYIKNHNSDRFKAIRELIEKNPDARITFLSGTPVKNRVNDVFAYLKLIGHPLGDNYAMFLREYTQTSSGRHGTKITGSRNLEDLYHKLSNFMIRKTKADCLDLPPKTIYKFQFGLDEYRDEYKKVITELSKAKGSSLHSNLHTLNIVMAKAKLKGIKDLAQSILDQDRKVVIFCSYTEPIRMLQEHFGSKCVMIDGSVSAHHRDDRIQKFIQDDDVTVFLGNVTAAGIGINLVNASDVIFCNFPFTPSEMYQAEDRCHRIGQKNNVNIYYTLCEESVDEYIYSLIVDKANDINALIDKGNEVTNYASIPEMLYKHLIEQGEIIPEDGKEVSAEAS